MPRSVDFRLDRIEAQFSALRYIAIDGTGHTTKDAFT